jgi:hypothetical protein
MTTTVSNFQGVNAAYGIEIQESGVKLPALQATTYQPRTMNEKVSLCLSEESFDMLDTEQGSGLGCTPVVCNFGDDDVTMWAIPDSCRFVVMGVPRLFILDKETGLFSYPVRGEKLAGTRKVTATRLLLAVLSPDGELLLDADARPQLFTLKLTSSKTALVSGDKYDPDFKSLQDLNKALQAHFKKRGVGLTHLVSVGLSVAPKKFTSKGSGETSLGVMFTLGSGAKPLPESQQLMTYELLKDAEVLALVQDPFHLKNRDEPATSSVEADYPNYDDIPI